MQRFEYSVFAYHPTHPYAYTPIYSFIHASLPHASLCVGVLCREFLLEFITTDTPIICAAKLTHPKPTDKAWKHKIVRLRDIYPFPPLYLGVQGNHVVEYGSALARANITPHELRTVCGSDGRWEELYQKVKAATQLDTRSHIHPLQYAGGVMFENGDMKVVWASKQLEFGGTIDVISKLSPYLEGTRVCRCVRML